MGADKRGTSQSAMLAAATKFQTYEQQFETAVQNLTAAVSELEQTWFGQSVPAFTSQMDKFKKDITDDATAAHATSVMIKQVQDHIQEWDMNSTSQINALPIR